jgi:hypothetical protein
MQSGGLRIVSVYECGSSMSVNQIVTALTETILYDRCDASARSSQNVAACFVLTQCQRMPDYLRVPFMCLTWGFDVSTIVFKGRPFHLLSQEQRLRQVHDWRTSPWGFQRDFMKFYETFVIFAYYSDVYAADSRRQTSGDQF